VLLPRAGKKGRKEKGEKTACGVFRHWEVVNIPHLTDGTKRKHIKKRRSYRHQREGNGGGLHLKKSQPRHLRDAQEKKVDGEKKRRNRDVTGRGRKRKKKNADDLNSPSLEKRSEISLPSKAKKRSFKRRRKTLFVTMR